ncbi:MAG: hypothetical protein WAO51_03605, partial [Bacillota bacterium]
SYRDSSVKVDRALILLIARKKTLAPDLSSFTLFGFQGTSAALVPHRKSNYITRGVSLQHLWTIKYWLGFVPSPDKLVCT